jgi:hypothetical protein
MYQFIVVIMDTLNYFNLPLRKFYFYVQSIITNLRRNCLLKHVIEGNIEVTRGRRSRHKQLVDDLQETRGYWNLKEEALDRAVWRTCFGRVYT